MIYNNRLLEPRSMIRMNFWKTTHSLSPKNTEEHEGLAVVPKSQRCYPLPQTFRNIPHRCHCASKPSQWAYLNHWFAVCKENIARAYGYGKQTAGRLVVQGPRRIGETNEGKDYHSKSKQTLLNDSHSKTKSKSIATSWAKALLFKMSRYSATISNSIVVEVRLSSEAGCA